MPIDFALGVSGMKPGVCTSSTRPANPYEGQYIYETDTNRTLVWDATSWVIMDEPWQTQAVTISQGVTPTRSATYWSEYRRSGKVCDFRLATVFSSGGTGGNIIGISPPVTPANVANSTQDIVGTGYYNSGTQYPVIVTLIGGNFCFLKAYDTFTNYFGSDPGVTIANNHILSLNVRYKIA